MARADRKSVRLDEAVAQYMEALESERLSASSIRSKRRTLEALTVAVGRANRGTRKLTEEHFTRCLVSLAEGATPEENEARRLKGLAPRLGRSPRTMEADRATLKQFVEFCKVRGWMAASFNPMFRLTKSTRAQGNKDSSRVFKRRRFDYEDWAALLDAAGKHHPRTRVIVAAGLHWGRRASEIAHLKWKHIHDGRVEFFNIKRGRPVNTAGMVISPWMQEELDRWRAWVEATHGPVQPDWHLCPVKLPLEDPRVLNPFDTPAWPVDPAWPMTPRAVTDDVRSAFYRYGWTEDEQLYGEGCHTLRRSHLTEVKKRGGLEAARASADHESTTQTLHYTGDREGQEALDGVMAGMVRPMAEAEPEPAKAPEPEHEAPPNVVDFAAWRARKAG